MNFKERKFRFTQGRSEFVFGITYVGFKEPYRHAKWLFTRIENGYPFSSEQFADDDSIKAAFGSIAIESDKVEIIEDK